METRNKAPLPQRGSIIRAVYETIDALGGANLKQIMEYMPAAKRSDGKPLPSKDKVLKALVNGVYRGYLIKAGEYWQVAPKDYFVTRRAKMLRMERNRRSGNPTRRLPTKKTKPAKDDIEAERQMESARFDKRLPDMGPLHQEPKKEEKFGWTSNAKKSVRRSAQRTEDFQTMERSARLLASIEETSRRLNEAIHKGKRFHWTRMAFYGLLAGNLLAATLTIGYLIGRGI